MVPGLSKDESNLADFVTGTQGRVSDQVALEDAFRLILKGVDDPSRPGLEDTPARYIKALREMTSGNHQDPAEILSRQFDVKCANMVVVAGIPFTSLCEHHVLPFGGTADVGYIPADKVVGLSKIARLVDCYSRRLQVQERLTEQIADSMEKHINTIAVGVVIRASHSCMSCRGVRKPDATMVTSAMRGTLLESQAARSEFLELCKPVRQ